MGQAVISQIEIVHDDGVKSVYNDISLEDLVGMLSTLKTVKSSKKKTAKRSTLSLPKVYSTLSSISYYNDGKEILLSFAEGQVIFCFQSLLCFHLVNDQKIPFAATHYERIKVKWDQISKMAIDDSNSAAEFLVLIPKYLVSNSLMGGRVDMMGTALGLVASKALCSTSTIATHLGALERLTKAGVFLVAEHYRSNTLLNIQRADDSEIPLNLNGKTPAEILRVDQWFVDFHRGMPRAQYFEKRACYRFAIVLKVDEISRYLISTYSLYPDESDSRVLKELINKYGYDVDYKALANYVVNSFPVQGLEIFQGTPGGRGREGLQLLLDYARMSTDLKDDSFDKYPKHLRSVHDIAMIKHRVVADECAKQNFKRRMLDKDVKKHEYKGKEFLMKLPTTPLEVQEEGRSLGHCVGSYVSRITDGETLIVFMRDVKQPHDSLLTIEIGRNYEIKQAKGRGNRRPTEKEHDFIWNKYVPYLQQSKASY